LMPSTGLRGFGFSSYHQPMSFLIDIGSWM
jgi:hypothetical protein